MYSLPSHMANRWEHRREPEPGQGQLYWHILFKGDPQLRQLAAQAQERLAPFTGLHLTPQERLHLTLMLVGPYEDFTEHSIKEMIERARQLLSGVSPITVALGRVFYHPEAIVLGVQPIGALDPVFEAVRDAARKAAGQAAVVDDARWIPHITLAYSTALQPAAPIIAALGQEIPTCEVTVNHVSLVLQEGPERLWRWRVMEEIALST